MSKQSFLNAENKCEICYDIENLENYPKKSKKKCMLPLSKLHYYDLDYIHGVFKRLNRLVDQTEFNRDRIVGVGFTEFKNHKEQLMIIAYKKDNKLKYATIAPRHKKPSLEEMKDVEE